MRVRRRARARPTTSATPDPADRVNAAFIEYWERYMGAAESGDVPATTFEGVAEGAFVERVLATLRSQAELGVTRTGRPTFGDFDAKVDGTAATSTVCVDERTWRARANGEDLDPVKAPPYRSTATLEQRGDDWVLVDLEREPKAEECADD